MRVVIATMRDVQELDISNMMGISRTFYVDENVNSDPENRKRYSMWLVDSPVSV